MTSHDRKKTDVASLGYTPEQLKKITEHQESSGSDGIVLAYKGYRGHVKTDVSGVLYGKIEGITDLVSYEASTLAEIQQSFVEAVDDYIQTCENLSKQ